MSEVVRVLVVDDDVDFRLLLSWQLGRQDGLDVVGDAADGFEALEQVEALRPDVVVIDLMMPGMDGFELIDRLNTDHAGVGKIAYSAMANDHARDQVARLGVELLTKSGDHAHLVEGIHRAHAEARGEAVERPGPGGPDVADRS